MITMANIEIFQIAIFDRRISHKLKKPFYHDETSQL